MVNGNSFGSLKPLQSKKTRKNLQVDFGSGLNNIAGFTDVTGSSRDNQFTVQVHTISDYLSNTVAIYDGESNNLLPKDDTANNGISALFTPRLANVLGLETVDQVAEFGGFNHFNWLQTVESMSSQIEILPGPDQGDIDPLLGGNNVDNADQFKWYLDEVLDPNEPNDFWKNLISADEKEFRFVDSPAFPIPGRVVFNTYLVGVKDGDEGSVFANKDGNSFKNLAFRWTYDQDFPFPIDGDSSFNGWLANTDLERGAGGSIQFLGFLEPEDWTDERVASLRDLGVRVAGLNGGQINVISPGEGETEDVPEPMTILGTILAGCYGIHLKRKNN